MKLFISEKVLNLEEAKKQYPRGAMVFHPEGMIYISALNIPFIQYSNKENYEIQWQDVDNVIVGMNNIIGSRRMAYRIIIKITMKSNEEYMIYDMHAEHLFKLFDELKRAAMFYNNIKIHDEYALIDYREKDVFLRHEYKKYQYENIKVNKPVPVAVQDFTPVMYKIEAAAQ